MTPGQISNTVLFLANEKNFPTVFLDWIKAQTLSSKYSPKMGKQYLHVNLVYQKIWSFISFTLQPGYCFLLRVGHRDVFWAITNSGREEFEEVFKCHNYLNCHVGENAKKCLSGYALTFYSLFCMCSYKPNTDSGFLYLWLRPKPCHYGLVPRCVHNIKPFTYQKLWSHTGETLWRSSSLF